MSYYDLANAACSLTSLPMLVYLYVRSLPIVPSLIDLIALIEWANKGITFVE
jgi:hypothetical protein